MILTPGSTLKVGPGVHIVRLQHMEEWLILIVRGFPNKGFHQVKFEDVLKEAQAAIPVNTITRAPPAYVEEFIVQYNDMNGFEGPFQTIQQAEAWIIKTFDLEEDFQPIIHKLYKEKNG